VFNNSEFCMFLCVSLSVPVYLAALRCCLPSLHSFLEGFNRFIYVMLHFLFRLWFVTGLVMQSPVRLLLTNRKLRWACVLTYITYPFLSDISQYYSFYYSFTVECSKRFVSRRIQGFMLPYCTESGIVIVLHCCRRFGKTSQRIG
jgi:hypothetical protein